MDAIVTERLGKSFGKTQALSDLDLRIRKGTVYGLLGPNGAGKTTTIRLLATLLKPTSGSATVMGHDIVREAKEVRRRVSLTGQFASVDEDLTGHENLVLVGRLLGFPWGHAKERATELLDAFGLADAAKRQVRTYSGGMRRRLDIASSLVSTPDVLFLDEPTTGLDPRSRNQVWDLVRLVANQGTTVLLTTQYLEEADRLATRLAVVDHGRLIAEGTSRDLKASIGGNTLHVTLADPAARETAETAVRSVAREAILPATEPGTLAIRVTGQSQATEVVDALTRRGVQVSGFSLGNPSLDDVFFAVTGKAPSDGQPPADSQPGPSSPRHDARDPTQRVPLKADLQERRAGSHAPDPRANGVQPATPPKTSTTGRRGGKA